MCLVFCMCVFFLIWNGVSKKTVGCSMFVLISTFYTHHWIVFVLFMCVFLFPWNVCGISKQKQLDVQCLFCFQHFLNITLPHHFTKNKKQPSWGKYSTKNSRGRPENKSLQIYTTRYLFNKEDQTNWSRYCNFDSSNHVRF